MRGFIRAILLLVLVVIVAFFALGWWTGSPAHRGPARSAGTAGTIDTEKARERGAEIGEKTAVAAERAQETAADAAITAKIKAKMALDDYVQSRRIDVSTNGSTVTLTGTVRSQTERDRAVRLARETNGVTEVVDRLNVAQ